MVDFWMTIGRAITNETLLETLLKALPPKEYPIDVELRGFKFTEAEYDRARAAITKGLKAAGLEPYPVSLMTLGEVLYTSSSSSEHETLRRAVKLMHAEKIGSDRDPFFYTALGAAVADPYMRKEFGEKNFEECNFGKLSAADKETLARIAKHHAFLAMASGFEDLWTIDCFVRAEFYPKHLHPATTLAIDNFLAEQGKAAGVGVGG